MVKLLYKAMAVGISVLSSAAFGETYTGIVHPQNDIDLSIVEAGVVESIPVEEGERVEKGQRLLALKDDLQKIELEKRKILWKQRAEVQAVRKRVSILEKMLKNTAELYEESGSVSQNELYQLRLKVIDARSQEKTLKLKKERQRLEYQEAESKLQRRRLTAPVSGTVATSELQVGEWAQPGERIFRLVDASICYLQVSVPRAVTKEIDVGDGVDIWVGEGGGTDAGGEPIRGEVKLIAPVADSASGLVEIQVQFDNSDRRITPGVKASVSIGQ